MAKEVALKITLDGVEQSIANITQLEAAILKAKRALTERGFGDEWDKFSRQIKNAESRLKDLRKQVEGQEFEQKVGAYAKVGSAITSSFAAAQTAISLFGTESEAVAEAAAKAQQTLTLALAGRELAEGAVAIQTVAADIATKAQTASTNAASAATKKFYTILANNPYAAILVGVGLLITAITLLISKTDEAAKKQKELEDAVNQAAGTEISKLKILQETLESETTTRKQKKQAIEEARKQYGPYLEKLDEEKLLTGELKLNYDELTQALIRKAKADVYSQEVAKLSKDELKLRKDLKTATDAQARAQRDLADAEAISRGVIGGGSAPGIGGASAVGITERQRVISTTKDFDQANKALNKNLEEQALYISEITKANQLNVEILGGETKALEKNTDAQKAYIEALQSRLNAQIEIIKGLNQLNEVDGKVSADVIDRANKLLADAQALIDKRNQFFKSEGEALGEEINDLLFKVIPSAEQLKTIQDGYLVAFNSISNAIKNGNVKLLDEQGKALDFGIASIKTKLKGLNVPQDLIDSLTQATPEAQTALVEFYTRLASTAERLSGGFSLAGQFIQFDKKTVEQNLGQLVGETQRILQDPRILKGLKDSEISKVINTLFTIPEKTLDDFGGNTEAAKVKLDAYNEGVKELRLSLIEFGKVQANQAIESKNVGNELAKVNAEIRKAREELGLLNEASDIGGGVQGPNSLMLSLEEQSKFIDFLVEKLKAAPMALDDVLNNVSKNYQKYVNRFGKEGLELLLVRVAEGFKDLDGYTAEQLNDLLITLTNNAKDISTQYGDEVAGSFEKLAERIRKALKKIPTESETSFNETLKNIQTGLAELQSVLNNLGQTFNEAYSAQLDILENRYTGLNQMIVGDTEQANAKRIELEKEYQAQRMALEKRAAKTNLVISLVQATANVAESITKALATGIPVVSQIAAGINAAIGAVQVGIIANQLSKIDQYKKGGIIKGMGGMVVGPSHEQGGVKFQGGGIELEGGEAVINRVSTVQYASLLDQINQNGGGKPLSVSNFDDSRIVEAIARQRNEPIRAYVVEQDITNKQAITRRLEQLSQF